MVQPDSNTPPVHILTHEFTPYTGGIAAYVRETALCLALNDVPVTVWAPDYGKDEHGIADNFPFFVRRVRMRGKQDWLCRYRMGKAFASEFPRGRVEGTVVLAEPGPIRWWMYDRWTRPPQCDKLVVIFHGSELLLLNQLPHRRRYLSRLIRRADKVGVVSLKVGQLLSQLVPDLEEVPVTVPGAVRHDWLNLPLAITGGRGRIVLQVGRVHPRKGQLHLVESLSLLPEDIRSTLSLRILGPVSNSRYADKVKTVAKLAGVKLDMPGKVSANDLKEAYKQSAVLVMPSQPYRRSVEGLGMAMIEAQHFGCPVIGCRTGGVPEAFIPGVSGLLVEPGNARALAGAIGQILNNPDKAAEMGSNGAAFVRRSFSWETNLYHLGLV